MKTNVSNLITFKNEKCENILVENYEKYLVL